MAAARLGALGMRHHVDDRREFWGDIFGLTEGDINVVRPKKGVFIGWHRHQRQDDHIFLISGALLVRMFETNPLYDGVELVRHESATRALVLIPRHCWHGYEALSDDTCILQFNGPGKWDGNDEERLDPKEMPWPS